MKVVYRLVMLLVATSSMGQLSAQHHHAQISYAKADSIAEAYHSYPLNNLRALATGLTTVLASDEEKFRAIYIWVCLNLEADPALNREREKNAFKLRNKPAEFQKWNVAFNRKVAAKLQHDYKTVCTGYAYLIKELAYFAGIECTVVNGYGRTSQANIGGEGIQNHAWNAVRLHNQWYLCDATWSAGAIELSTGNFIRRFEEGYFLADPSRFVRNHYPADTSWMLLQQKPSLATFLIRPLIYAGIYDYVIDGIYPETFKLEATKGKPLTFRFDQSHPVAWKKAELEWVDAKDNVHRTDAKIRKDSMGSWEVEHIFSSAGSYSLHLVLDSVYVFSYSVKVSR